MGVRTHGLWIGTGGALAALMACSGGAPPPAAPPPPPPTNSAPVFSGPAQVNVNENVAGTAFSLTASDANGDPLTFAVAGGADANTVQVNPANGSVSFVQSPDFEFPRDANRDNLYEVDVSVSDGRGGSASRSVTISITDLRGPIRARRLGTGFSAPLFATAFPDGSGRLLILEQAGRILLFDPAASPGTASPVFLDISATISSGGERGLLGLALAPDFMTSGFFYVNVTNPAGDTEIRRYSAPAPRVAADPRSGDVILFQTQPFINHNGGWLGFGPDRLLYIGLGDGGSAGDPQGNGQNRGALLGKILRIDPASDAFPADPNRDYRIPPDNPFAAGGGALEVWAFGLRNPFRASFDRANGDLYIGDVGQDNVEEVDRIPAGRAGLNFGWAILEGTRSFRPGTTTGLTPPVAEYLHGSGPFQGNAVTGGYVYRGPIVPLRGTFIWGDFVNRRLWSVPVTSLRDGTTLASTGFSDRTSEWASPDGPFGNIASFGEDERGNLYIVEFSGVISVLTEFD